MLPSVLPNIPARNEGEKKKEREKERESEREREKDREKELENGLRDRELNHKKGIPIHVHTCMYVPGSIIDNKCDPQYYELFP